jgi:hypothetical protein
MLLYSKIGLNMSIYSSTYSAMRFRAIAPWLQRDKIKSHEDTLSIIEYPLRGVASDPKFNINDPYFQTTQSPCRLFYLPGVLELFCELGYHIDGNMSIQKAKSRFIEWLNDRGLDDNGCEPKDVVLAAFRVLGRWSRSKEMVEVIAQSNYTEAKRAFNEGKSEFFVQLSNTVKPVLENAGVTTALISIVLDYAKDEIVKLQPESGSNIQENMP